jgi:hypothetical protein
MTLRTGKWMPHNSEVGDLHQRLQGTGFVILGEVPDKELVIGVAGQFWRLDGGRCTDLTPQQFPGFSRPGYSKVAWNFKLQSKSAATTVLSTETRIKCFGKALWRFRLYWSVVGPFSGLIRKAILKQVKVAAEIGAPRHEWIEFGSIMIGPGCALAVRLSCLGNREFFAIVEAGPEVGTFSNDNRKQEGPERTPCQIPSDQAQRDWQEDWANHLDSGLVRAW